MKNFDSVLVTGGAGYIGSVLTSKLIENGYYVRVVDSLIYGDKGISKMVNDGRVDLIYDDIRKPDVLENAVKNIDCIIHLAAIVGEPLCKKIPDAAKQINEDATFRLVEIAKKTSKRFVYASTCSNYGSSNEVVDENTPVSALSLYSETKVNSEKKILSEKKDGFEPSVLRFATAFGISPRMRFDLLLQEFIRDAVIDKKISIFGPNYWRPLVHVSDIVKACMLIIESSSELVSGQIYNVGDDSQNFTKIELGKLIQKYLPETKIDIVESKKDPRNYKVSFNKIKSKLNYKIMMTVEEGIKEILEKIKNNEINPAETEFSNMSKMTEKVKSYSF